MFTSMEYGNSAYTTSTWKNFGGDGAQSVSKSTQGNSVVGVPTSKRSWYSTLIRQVTEISKDM